MKTKTNSFTKVIIFCVLTFFLIINMIFFTSCDNGNSPNDNTNEEQNNNAPTDYCEICDGVQIENCGIKHKCDDENCVEYSDNRIYKNGHTHDYCERTDCDGSTHLGADHPTDTSWFKETPIGGEDSPYKVFVIDNNAYNETNDFTAKEKINDYLDEYIKCINSFPLNKELTDEIEIPTTAIKNMAGDNAEWRFDALIGTISKNEISTNTIGINDVCAPAIETITKNIGISGNNALDKQFFTLYYMAISNEIYRMGYNGEITTKTECIGNETEMEQKYIDTKKDCSKYDGYTVLPFENKYFYLENGELNPEVVQQFNKMITEAATKLNVIENDLYNIINLSFTASSIEGIHDYLSSTLLVNEHKHTDECYNNEMVDVIGDVEVDEMTPYRPSQIKQINFQPRLWSRIGLIYVNN